MLVDFRVKLAGGGKNHGRCRRHLPKIIPRAHPHVWVTYHLKLLFARGKLAAIRQQWAFDEDFSSMLLADRIKGYRRGKPRTSKGIAGLRDHAFNNLDEDRLPMTPSVTRATAFLALTGLLFALVAAPANAVGTPGQKAPLESRLILPEPFRFLLGKAVVFQSKLNARLRSELSAVRHGNSWFPARVIVFAGFLYGVLHAVGPMLG